MFLCKSVGIFFGGGPFDFSRAAIKFGRSAYSGQQVIAEYTSGANPSSPTEQYVYASYIDEPILKDGTLSSGTGLVYYSRNQQYSITGLTDSSGNVVERYSYSAYGDLTVYDSVGTSIANSAYANSNSYTGREIDSETEIYHFRARMYDSELGRFIGRDPLAYVDGLNLHRQYFGLQNLDPQGHYSIQDDFSKIGADFVIDFVNAASFSNAVEEDGGLVGPPLPIVVKRVRAGTDFRKARCGFELVAGWRFEIHGDAPCDGYLIQKITSSCEVGGCRDIWKPDFKEELVFYEAFPVKEDEPTYEHPDEDQTQQT